MWTFCNFSYTRVFSFHVLPCCHLPTFPWELLHYDVNNLDLSLWWWCVLVDHGLVITVVLVAMVTVIKQRMQVGDSPYKTCRECAVHVYRKEGMHAFYRSFFTQLAMNIPFQSIHFIMYEACQDMLNPGREYHPLTHCASGAVAGAVAAAATTPLDVCKTLLNTQERLRVLETPGGEQGRIEGLSQAVRTINSCCGPRGFFRGLTARVIYQMPSTAISWSIYELFKHYLLDMKSKSSDDGYVGTAHAQAQQPVVTSSSDETGSIVSIKKSDRVATVTPVVS